MAAGSLPDTWTSLFEALRDIRRAHAPELHVYELWRPDMAFPAMWLWMRDSGAVESVDGCNVTRTPRLLVMIGVEPQERFDEDRRTLVEYIQLVNENLDPIIYGPGRPFGQSSARWAAGAQLLVMQMGAAEITCAELPIEVTLRTSIVGAEP